MTFSTLFRPMKRSSKTSRLAYGIYATRIPCKPIIRRSQCLMTCLRSILFFAFVAFHGLSTAFNADLSLLKSTSRAMRGGCRFQSSLAPTPMGRSKIPWVNFVIRIRIPYSMLRSEDLSTPCATSSSEVPA